MTLSRSSRRAPILKSISARATTKPIPSTAARRSWFTPEAAQPFAARALEVAQVVGIVDDAADVDVLVVDAHLPGERPRPVWLLLHRRIVACAMLSDMAGRGAPARPARRRSRIIRAGRCSSITARSRSSGPDPASIFEALFARNRWPAAWRNGVHPFHHYHSNGHEALGVYSGEVTVQFGGDAGVTITAKPGRRDRAAGRHRPQEALLARRARRRRRLPRRTAPRYLRAAARALQEQCRSAIAAGPAARLRSGARRWRAAVRALEAAQLWTCAVGSSSRSLLPPARRCRSGGRR